MARLRLLVRGLLERTRLTFVDGMWLRPGARWRWATVAVLVVVLVSLPAVVAALPVSVPALPVAQLLARVRSSGHESFTGVATSSGRLALPDLSSLSGDVDSLLSDTNRFRVWYASSQEFRVDRITTTSEHDIYVRGPNDWTWDSDTRRATFEPAGAQLRLPRLPDALPTELGRRLLADAPANAVQPTDARRVAGQATQGLRWRPHDPRSLVGSVEAWVQPSTGLVLALSVAPVAGGVPGFEASFLDFSLGPPDPQALVFRPEADQTTTITALAPPGGSNNRQVLPATVGGLPKRSANDPVYDTFGAGVSLVAIAPLDCVTAMSLRSQIDRPDRPPVTGAFGTASLVTSSLLDGLVLAAKDRGYVLVGSVTADQLELMATELVEHPPPKSGDDSVPPTLCPT